MYFISSRAKLSASPAPTAVTELRVEPVNSTQLSISWELPDNPNGPLSHYLVFHREQNSSQIPSPDTNGCTESRVDYPQVSMHFTVYSESPVLNVNDFVSFCVQTCLIINGLDPFTWYSVIVQAVGEGDLEGLVTAESVLVNHTHADVDTPPSTNTTAVLVVHAHSVCNAALAVLNPCI